MHRIIEIADNGRYLSADRGFCVVSKGERVLGRIPLDDIAVLLLSAPGITLSKALLQRLAEGGALVMVCGSDFLPQSLLMPIAAHSLVTKNIKTQIAASLPFKKRIWQQIVVCKIRYQARTLQWCDKDPCLVGRLADQVKSGDSDLREAAAAKLYWSLLFGQGFVRDREAEGVNRLLNYGYAVMRASMARAVCAAGLLPSLGVNHHNNYNAFCLADDFFEIYRPLVDYEVYQLWQEGSLSLTPEVKRRLVQLLWVKAKTNRGESPVFQSMHYMVISYLHAMEAKKPSLECPVWGEVSNEKNPIEQVRNDVDDGTV